MSEFDDLLAEAKRAREVEPETVTVSVLLAGKVVDLKFTELPGKEWAEITVRNPPRLDVPLDINKGYNVNAASEEAAIVSGVRVDGDDEVPLTREQWATLWPLLAGNYILAITDAIWALNDWAPANRLEQAKKGSRAAGAPSKK